MPHCILSCSNAYFIYPFSFCYIQCLVPVNAATMKVLINVPKWPGESFSGLSAVSGAAWRTVCVRLLSLSSATLSAGSPMIRLLNSNVPSKWSLNNVCQNYCCPPFWIPFHFDSIQLDGFPPSPLATSLRSPLPLADLWGGQPQRSALGAEEPFSSLFTCRARGAFLPPPPLMPSAIYAYSYFTPNSRLTANSVFPFEYQPDCPLTGPGIVKGGAILSILFWIWMHIWTIHPPLGRWLVLESQNYSFPFSLLGVPEVCS